jgi:integrase
MNNAPLHGAGAAVTAEGYRVGAGASLGLPIIGKLLGHSQAATTARYSHLAADPMMKAANVIGKRISAALKGETAAVVPFKRSR